MRRQAYTLTMPPTRSTSVIFASPHSGRAYPWSFRRRAILDERVIRSSEDAFVDDLFAAAPSQGAPLLAATAPRAFVDVNRAADELDPALVEGAPRGAQNPRVASGLGVIPRVVSNGRAIYAGRIGLKEARARVRTYWEPYHRALAGLMEQSVETFGEAILIDCHSMPHEAIEQMPRPGRRLPDIVLGDRFGAAADPSVVARIEAAFDAAGLRTARNTPFAGAYVTQAYGRPSRRRHVVQVEIDRRLYMDEAEVRPSHGYAGFRELLAGVISDVCDIGRGSLSLPTAAE